MDQEAELRLSRHWQTAVMALRIGYVALAVVAVGLVLLASGSTPWVLAAGICLWLPAAIVTAVEFMRGRHGLPEPRPGFTAIRLMLLRDSIRVRPPRAR